jgi:hypothetical protein
MNIVDDLMFDHRGNVQQTLYEADLSWMRTRCYRRDKGVPLATCFTRCHERHITTPLVSDR